MMSTELIRDISNVAAYRAAEEGRTPLVPWRSQIESDIRHAPFLGEYVPEGWREAEWGDLPAKPRSGAIPWGNGERALFMVDSSGFGSYNEPALTFPELAAYLTGLIDAGNDIGIGIVESGQFQIVMGIFLRDALSKGKPAPDFKDVVCDECGTVHDGMEECDEYALQSNCDHENVEDDETYPEGAYFGAKIVRVTRCFDCGAELEPSDPDEDGRVTYEVVR